jgi:hypothetical protein
VIIESCSVLVAPLDSTIQRAGRVRTRVSMSVNDTPEALTQGRTAFPRRVEGIGRENKRWARVLREQDSTKTQAKRAGRVVVALQDATINLFFSRIEQAFRSWRETSF